MLLISFFILTFLVCLFGLRSATPNKNLLNNVLSFSGAYLLGVTLIHILPDFYIANENIILSGTFILLGFLMQIILQSKSKGLEHGHFHTHSKALPVSIFTALIIHALVEGTILHEKPDNELYIIFAGILVHRLPIAFILGFMLKETHASLNVKLFFLLLFSIATPLGAMFPSLFLESNTWLGALFTGLVSGSFLHISTTILFESSPEHKLKWTRFASAFLGMVIAVLSSLLNVH